MIIGIDCATDPKKVGLALAEAEGGECRLKSVQVPETWGSLVEQAAVWLMASRRALLALDAPLGWPAALGLALTEHRAGEPIGDEPNLLFRRATDRFVKDHLGKQPLDVGADRIARTAQAALRFLSDVRRRTDHPIPLAWSHRDLDRPAAIEVYPAGTLTAHGIRASGYKKAENEPERTEIIRSLGERLEIPQSVMPLIHANADALDAVVCTLAADDFINGRAMPPPDLEQALSEGWIWVSAPSQSR